MNSVSYISKDGCLVDLENLRHNLSSAAADLATTADHVQAAGDHETAFAIGGAWAVIDSLIPGEGGSHDE